MNIKIYKTTLTLMLVPFICISTLSFAEITTHDKKELKKNTNGQTLNANDLISSNIIPAKFPPNYSGDDIASIASKLNKLKNLEKDEFTSKDKQNQKVQTELNKLNQKRFIFVLNEDIGIDAVGVNYDPETQLNKTQLSALTMSDLAIVRYGQSSSENFDDSSYSNYFSNYSGSNEVYGIHLKYSNHLKGMAVGTTRFGLKMNVSRFQGKSYMIAFKPENFPSSLTNSKDYKEQQEHYFLNLSMNSDEARKLKGHLSFAFVSELNDLPVIKKRLWELPGVDNPQEYRTDILALPVKVYAVIVFNKKTGEIYKSYSN